ncbi:HD family phosphohydrolase [Cerasicoccus fimbriatus]|uniref:HD family phosphohydrolase n=1 Tax=Cerasicoccus fimbriatus TaxID=3014554 RepID=UPI0022B37143|nr:HDIG domain-containing metalloprotein [Cerasicoccus sp. TK19100]
MPILPKKKSKKQQAADARRKRRDAEPKKAATFFETSQIVSAGIFLLIAVAIVVICFLGQSPAGPPVTPGQTAKVRIVADFPFSYESKLETERVRQQRRQRVVARGRYVEEPYQQFADSIAKLDSAIETELMPELVSLPKSEWEPVIDQFTATYGAETGFYISDDDIAILLEKTTPAERSSLLREGSLALRDVMRDGVYEEPGASQAAMEGSLVTTMVVLGLRSENLQTEQEAARLLNINLAGLGDDLSLSRALYRIFRKGVQPNVVYDSEATEKIKDQAAASVDPVTVSFQQGQVIVEPGNTITPEQVEAVAAYRKRLNESAEIVWGFNATLVQRSLMTVVLMICGILFMQTVFSIHGRSNRRFGLIATVLLVNLILLRLIQQLGETPLFGGNATLLALLSFAAPVALGAIMMAILVGPRPAALMAITVSALHSLMWGGSVDVFLTSLLGGMVAILYARDVRLRGKLMRAGLMSGLAVALIAAFMGFLNELAPVTVGQQVLTAIFSGVLTAVVVIGLLPLLEQLFKYTTDITLLELTDFNHPLLRKLQMDAPGTYHHSLMVANLAERAANEIGANPLLCRATSLFHDIGKMVKPEYFTENQHEGYNPHDELTPAMSALIIKSHVKEGVDMAKQNKLPEVFIDIIRQHHGTTLIKYFYSKACNRQQQTVLPLQSGISNPPFDTREDVDESTFRYEGPKPQTLEAAVIFFADAVEAASRSLKKVTPQSVEELVDSIFSARLDDGQLDEAPMTVAQIRKVRDSFCFTLLNMLHSRVQYPKDESGKKKRGQSAAPVPMNDPASDAPNPSNKRTAV